MNAAAFAVRAPLVALALLAIAAPANAQDTGKTDD